MSRTKKSARLLSDQKNLKKLIDWLFKEIVFILSNKRVKIYKIKRIGRLHKKLKSAITVYKFFEGGAIKFARIFLVANRNYHHGENHANSLVHEVLHLLFPIVYEEDIQRLEFKSEAEEKFFLWDLFSKEQQGIIKSFIPRHTVKKRPE